MKRTICVVTGSRADYGHLRGLIKEIQNDQDLKLQLVVTGAHLSKQHGLTYKNIEQDGFKIDTKVNVLHHDDTQEGITRTMGIACQKFAKVFKKLMPNLVVLLGDRYEIFAVAVAAYVARIPIAHIHGGEVTKGAFDEAFRHAITKMSHIHFAATEIYRRRIIQLGEHPKYVFNFGAPGLDCLYQQGLLDKDELAKELDFVLDGDVAIMTYHPVTLEKRNPLKQLKTILDVINGFDLKVIFTEANADTNGQWINRCLKEHAKRYPQKYKFIVNLGQRNYFSCLKHFNLVLGNSSSGIIEAPSFGIPVVNIGDRQKGRIKAKNIIDADDTQDSIRKGIKKALSPQFYRFIRNIKNPYLKYTDGRINFRIKEKLKSLNTNEDLVKKQFFNIRFKC